MATADGVFIFVGTYPSKAAAEADYGIVKDLHDVGDIGTFDAAVITKDADGKVHENKDEMATRHGAWGGLAVGALFGLLFPPAILGWAAAGAAIGGVGGHLWRGLSRKDVKELGEFIDAGEACLLVVGESKVAEAIDKAELKAEKQFSKQLDVDTKDLSAAVEEAAKEMAAAQSAPSGDVPKS